MNTNTCCGFKFLFMGYGFLTVPSHSSTWLLILFTKVYQRITTLGNVHVSPILFAAKLAERVSVLLHRSEPLDGSICVLYFF